MTISCGPGGRTPRPEVTFDPALGEGFRITSFGQPVSPELMAMDAEAKQRASSSSAVAGGGSGLDGITAQFSGIYQSRLEGLKPRALAAARAAWPDIPASQHVDKVLDMPLLGDNSLESSQHMVGKIPWLGLTATDRPSAQRSVVCGVIYAELPGKPNVIDELSRLQNIRPVDPATRPASFGTPTKGATPRPAFFALEDESGRLILSGPRIFQEMLVTGVVCAILGVQLIPGELFVRDICFPLPAPQRPLPSASNTGNSLLALTSNWSLGAGTAGTPAALLDMLVDWVAGRVEAVVSDEEAGDQLGGLGSMIPSASKRPMEPGVPSPVNITRLIVAGNLFSKQADYYDNQDVGRVNQRRREELRRQEEHTAAQMAQADLAIAQLAQCVHVDVMPGDGDPTPMQHPQQPLPGFVFPRSRRLPLFSTTTNPYAFSVDGVDLVGISGQALDDIIRYMYPLAAEVLRQVGIPVADDRPDSGDLVPGSPADMAARFHAAELLLRACHWSPTAPDTLPCFPFWHGDRLLASDTRLPHVLFIGNQPAFASRVVTLNQKLPDRPAVTVRVVMVPGLATTGQIALLNLPTLEVDSMHFSTASSSSNSIQP
ncbi:hypothetical protein H696_02616 [Fonticula alba]|uniref:DNA polymerase alpha/delta/epsilon subunit B domain-containing protein n=1 Tax=Fonticula alba TaxID=691883 RepID=A0A058Z841_FONAL|nr:hypothetical protein H696_02616 [Fonticula alba]KCV70286.1 hypothetical protein H696_02616 [Fonticula alba]|eukprot:XP_009494802.1 hypothetical protein H696_02616 [Fonticula alba]